MAAKVCHAVVGVVPLCVGPVADPLTYQVVAWSEGSQAATTKSMVTQIGVRRGLINFMNDARWIMASHKE
jgi:hypothetical protein